MRESFSYFEVSSDVCSGYDPEASGGDSGAASHVVSAFCFSNHSSQRLARWSRYRSTTSKTIVMNKVVSASDRSFSSPRQVRAWSGKSFISCHSIPRQSRRTNRGHYTEDCVVPHRVPISSSLFIPQCSCHERQEPTRIDSSPDFRRDWPAEIAHNFVTIGS